MNVELKPGDVFASSNPQALGCIINTFQRLYSRDGQSEYGHAGVILSPEGDTFEALWTIKRSHLSKYNGEKIMVARWKCMDEAAFKRGFDAVQVQEGQWYPFGRLLLHMLRLPKVAIKNREVCSELTCHFLVAAGARMISRDRWFGTTPDDLVDEWGISEYFDIVFEGICDFSSLEGGK